MTQPEQRAGAKPTSTRFLAEVRGLGSAVENGSVTLVGAGPGDPELLTLRAVRALQSADVILFDDLVSRDVLDFARREAKKMLVGKTGYGPSCKQDEINALMVSLAKPGQARGAAQGRRSADLRPRRRGDRRLPRRPALPVEIVPGITAAQGAAAELGIPLTDRGHARRLQYVTGHARNGAAAGRYRLASLADPSATTAVYMPAQDARRAGRARAGRRPRRRDAGARHCARHPARPAIDRRADRRVAGAACRRRRCPGPVLVMIGGVCAAAEVQTLPEKYQRAL